MSKMSKKKILKKIVTGCLLSGVLIGGLSTNGYCANTADHYWQLYEVLGDSGYHYINELRSKTNTTPAYVSITGTDDMDGDDDYVSMFVVDQDHNSLQGGIASKTAYGRGQYSIHSNAYELINNSPVTIGFYAPYRRFYSWSAWGNWSPDSTREYN